MVEYSIFRLPSTVKADIIADIVIIGRRKLNSIKFEKTTLQFRVKQSKVKFQKCFDRQISTRASVSNNIFMEKENFLFVFFPCNIRQTFIVSSYQFRLESATSHLRLEPDWPSILVICDSIRQNDVS